MLPLQQAYEVQHSILEYLKATFSFKDRAVHEAFYKFVTDAEDGIFKGPYVSLKLPFVKANTDDVIPLQIAPGFPPYDHQYKAFQRLTTQDGRKPKSTLVTTGTSSGKTECFLYPILDFCYKNEDRKGIKIIILYPMNALATDQAKRLAETIWNDERLKGKVSAGLFIGEGKDKKKFPKVMGENHIIENRDTIGLVKLMNERRYVHDGNSGKNVAVDIKAMLKVMIPIGPAKADMGLITIRAAALIIYMGKCVKNCQ